MKQAPTYTIKPFRDGVHTTYAIVIEDNGHDDYDDLCHACPTLAEAEQWIKEHQPTQA